MAVAGDIVIGRKGLRLPVSGAAGAFDFRLAMPAGSTYTRTGAATGLTVAGTLTAFAANEPQRTDRGLALEASRTNLIASSQNLSAGTVTATGTGVTPVITANTDIAPDGTLTADRLQLGIGAGVTSGDLSQYNSELVAFTSGTAQASGVYLKTRDGSTKAITRVNPNGGSGSITVTGEWQRFTLGATPGSTSTGNLRLRLRGSEGTASSADLAVWQLDVQDGATTITSPIFTTGATATRGLPVFTEPVPSGFAGALLTYADASTTLVTGLTPGGTFDVATAVIGAGKGVFGVSELATRVWLP